MIGIFLLGILLFTASFGQTFANEEGGEEEPCDEEDPKDGDNDGVDDEYEEENKRYVEIWFGENVVELASIKRSDDQKDIMELRIGYNDYGISIAVSFRTMTKVVCEDVVEGKGEGESDKDVAHEFSC